MAEQKLPNLTQGLRPLIEGTAGGGIVTIEARNRSLEAGGRGFGELQPGNYVMLTISDRPRRSAPGL